MVGFLTDHGLTHGSLLIVPDFHYRWPLERDKAFCAYVRGLIYEGWEPILHGFSHLDDAGEGPSSLRARFAAKHMTAQEGEFLSLDEDEAAHRLRAGLQVLEDALGVRPRGFVPPAWLCGRGGQDALAQHGFAHTEDHVFIEDLTEHRRVFAPALGWASRSLRRRLSSSFFSHCATPLLARLPVVRLALHPGDFHYASLTRAIERSLLRFLESGFSPMTYGEYLGTTDALENQ